MEQNKSSIGGTIATILIIAIIILGGLYFWGKRIEETKLKQSMVSGDTYATEVSNQANANNAVSSSTNNN
jgi:hypothetical protein